MANNNQTTPESDNDQSLNPLPASMPTEANDDSENGVFQSVDSGHEAGNHEPNDDYQSLDSSPPRVVNQQTIPDPSRSQMFPLIDVKSMSEFIKLQVIVELAGQLQKIWLMIVQVLPQGIPCDLQDIYAAMLRCFKPIPFKNWKKSVRKILVSECQRSDSPINQYNEGSIIVDVDIESWLSTREDYCPDIMGIAQEEVEKCLERSLSHFQAMHHPHTELN